ncbi:hypothetical protein AB0E08_06110 [Streptomyces sp. NPDC048281]|uniref:hypothetical protein n=1 Tax=Streptomyces sp. NPDC048281 TaxID=3154715 RepID=UPI003413EA34
MLGVVAGTCIGYLVRVDREPTALPPLSQPSVVQAKGAAPEPLSAAQDRKVKVDGDLRKLLLKKPRGAREGLVGAGEDGWMDLADYAETYKYPAGAFRSLTVDNEFRRAAVTDWREGSTFSVEIRLVQFREEEKGTEAADEASGGNYYAITPDNYATKSWPIPGTGDGMACAHCRPETSYGVSLYSAEAHAWRGDVEMQVWIYGTKPIPKVKVLDLANRQMKQL